MKIRKIKKDIYSLEKEERMNISPKIFANQEIINTLKRDELKNQNNSLNQLKNLSSLPGLKGVVALADIHPGYGAPIGSATASDLREGVITFASTGFDINCGIHSLVLPITAKELNKKKKEFAESLFKDIPAGVGVGGKLRIDSTQMDELLKGGAEYVVKRGYGKKKDLNFLEEKGRIKKIDVTSVSLKAKERARDQIGTLGSGNHYCEIQEIEKIYDLKSAKKFGLIQGGTFVSIHCGSRAIGHQIGSDYLPILDSAVKKYGININNRDLVCAPFNSEEGQKYFSAIKAGTNAAFANRQVIGVLVKRSFEKVFGLSESEVKTFYDVGHNTAKIETHKFEGKKRKVLVQRKGSTRGFGPNNLVIPKNYRVVGQPVIVGGSMGTNSFILRGTKEAMNETFGSTIHGAGRSMSRSEAISKINGEDLLKKLFEKGIVIKAHSTKGLAEEAPLAYKNIIDVVNTMDLTNISKKVAKLKPIICIKG
ncbi:MAG: RtcB family protein [Candidatus ainarchaeum sp.]|jgi:tRNA-splicing ligase RtcB (3'-phosphate/5'-hydroxy nucleic acid ligase)|nr:RtcB family protein [Candidatus ainarchaeum sp.]